MKRIVTVMFTLLCVNLVYGQDKKVAVFDPSGSVGSDIRDIVREEISSIVVNTNGYTVLERKLIDRVLAESQFQMSGEVDDNQIGELGRKLGANYVLVSSVTHFGNNFYISCKLIDVITARIDKQKTGKTSNGMTDIDVVIRAIINEMLLGIVTPLESENEPNPAPQQQKAVSQPPAVSPPVAAENHVPQQKGYLTVQKWTVYQDNLLLNPDNVRNLMQNNRGSLQLYNKAQKQKLIGTILIWSGAGIAVAGSILGSLGGQSEYYSDNSYYYEESSVNGYAIVGVGAAITAGGFGLRFIAKKSIRKAVDTYNTSKYTSSLEFGITPTGIGFVYNF
ncbi:MAG: CsgG/HfaB family protein [Bacteroidales bacterium]|nr:CsgG/HfaB family protein [Bacteroidales bacterium]